MFGPRSTPSQRASPRSVQPWGAGPPALGPPRAPVSKRGVVCGLIMPVPAAPQTADPFFSSSLKPTPHHPGFWSQALNLLPCRAAWSVTFRLPLSSGMPTFQSSPRQAAGLRTTWGLPPSQLLPSQGEASCCVDAWLPPCWGAGEHHCGPPCPPSMGDAMDEPRDAQFNATQWTVRHQGSRPRLGRAGDQGAPRGHGRRSLGAPGAALKPNLSAALPGAASGSPGLTSAPLL